MASSTSSTWKMGLASSAFPKRKTNSQKIPSSALLEEAGSKVTSPPPPVRFLDPGEKSEGEKEESFNASTSDLVKDEIYHAVIPSSRFPLSDLHASIYVKTMQSYFMDIRNNILHCKKESLRVNYSNPQALSRA